MYWYNTEAANSLLNATESGRFAFLWQAKLNDGSVVRQFPEELFLTYLNNEVPITDDQRVSVDKLDVRKVQEFVLTPSGIARKHAPWLSPVRLLVDLEAGEKFISFWCVDRNPNTGKEIARHVVGISKPVNGLQAKFFVVVSCTGTVTLATNENQSFEGE